MQKKFSGIPKEQNDKCIAEVITRIEEIESERVGVIAAQDVIDIVVENLGPDIYNSAIQDTKKLLQEKIADIEFEIDELKQS